MVRETDLLIIGGGMAGAVAAIHAAKSGLRTTLVRPGYGATAISSGAINVNGTIEWLRRVQGADKSFEALVGEATSSFLHLMAEAGNPYAGDYRESKLLINVLGTIKQAQFCPETMATGDLRHLGNAQILFVGFLGLSDFDANYISKSISFFSESKQIDAELRTGWIEIEFPRVKHTSNISAFDLARLMDNGQIATEVVERIRAKADLGQYTHIAFPPILGIEDPKKTLTILQDQLGLPCFEVLAVPPSVPGYRLQKALDRLMDRFGVEIIHGRASGFLSGAGRIDTVQAVDKSVHYDFKPKAVVLASGKFLSGGVQWVGHLKEAVFDLPVCVDGTFDIPAGMGTLISDQFFADQKMFSAGLKVDEKMHPVAPNGQVIFHNLMAAGSVLTGYNYTQGEGGLGIPLLSSLVCARVAAEQIAGEGAVI